MESQPIIYTENKPSVTNKVVNCRFIGVMAMTFGQLLRQKLVEKGKYQCLSAFVSNNLSGKKCKKVH